MHSSLMNSRRELEQPGSRERRKPAGWQAVSPISLLCPSQAQRDHRDQGRATVPVSSILSLPDPLLPPCLRSSSQLKLVHVYHTLQAHTTSLEGEGEGRKAQKNHQKNEGEALSSQPAPRPLSRLPCLPACHPLSVQVPLL